MLNNAFLPGKCVIAQGGAHTQRHYLADGTLVGIDDVFVFSPTTAGMVSVAWEGGMLLPGTGADYTNTTQKHAHILNLVSSLVYTNEKND